MATDGQTNCTTIESEWVCQVRAIIQDQIETTSAPRAELMLQTRRLLLIGYDCHGACKVQQVIRQVWISTHFGVISKRRPSADEGFLFTTAVFTPPRLRL